MIMMKYLKGEPVDKLFKAGFLMYSLKILPA